MKILTTVLFNTQKAVNASVCQHMVLAMCKCKNCVLNASNTNWKFLTEIHLPNLKNVHVQTLNYVEIM